MLLDNNTDKVIDLLDMYDNLSNIDKIRLAIYLLENKNFVENNYDTSFIQKEFDT